MDARSEQAILERVRDYYEGKLAEHGATHAGVDWNSAASQQLRFQELTQVLAEDPAASVNDYGCGYGALAAYLRSIGHSGRYCGYDLSERMIEAAHHANAGYSGCEFVASRAAMTPADYTIASGIFNVKQGISNDRWRKYLIETIADLAALSTKGFAFNALTSYSDPERRRQDLYYADPCELFDHCQRHISRFVSLRHASPLYEFTMIVKL